MPEIKEGALDRTVEDLAVYEAMDLSQDDVRNE